jgi:hypothetical protein
MRIKYTKQQRFPYRYDIGRFNNVVSNAQVEMRHMKRKYDHEW